MQLYENEFLYAGCLTLLKPPNCTVFDKNTSRFEECEHVVKYLSSFSYMYNDNSIPLPISPNLIYLAVFGSVFITTVILHWSECTVLIYSLVFFLALPFGYLLLPIYSTANIHKQDWGTREKCDTKDEGLLGYWKKLKATLYLCRKHEPLSRVEEGIIPL